MAKRHRPAFEPNPDQMAMMPDISGNTVNGQGEAEFRRPSRIYWHNPKAIPHGKLQAWMVKRFNNVPDFRDAYAKGDRGPHTPNAIAENQTQDSPSNWTVRAKEFALQHEADLVGIARFNPDWTYAECEPHTDPWIIVLGVEMDYDMLAESPSSDTDTASALEVANQYNRSARVAAHLANWIRNHGHHSQPHSGPWAGSVTMIPAALACGFGELGKHGSIINREYGSMFRLSAVVTDMPLVADQATEFEADTFCTRCQVCINACPVDAITDLKQLVRGAEKWYVDFDKCIPYFNETHGCGICIAVCPWSRPGTAPRLAEKMLRRKKRLEETA